MGIIEIVIYLLLMIGLFFNILGIVGLLKFPDVYTRLHAETKTTTFGSIFISLSVAVYGLWQYWQSQDNSGLALSIHVMVAIVVLAFTNATGSHAIAQAAYSRGQKPNPAVVDRLDGVEEFKEDIEE